jgi:tRNA (cytidine32/uridine32-2'-O)-methyltransferase
MDDEGELGRIRVVMVEPSHPGNIGATARAMGTMGLGRLRLVRPRSFPSAEATARASGADGILYRAEICDSLEAAVADCALVVGTSARMRRLRWPELSPREFAERALEASAAGPVALVLGRERAGLDNHELERCHALAVIPTAAEHSSLNVAAAAQVFAYELRVAWLARQGQAGPSREAAGGPPEEADGGPAAGAPGVTAAELEGLFVHLEETLVRIGYLDPERPKLLMRRLRRLFARAGIEPSELRILRGVLAAVQRAADGGDPRRN